MLRTSFYLARGQAQRLDRVVGEVLTVCAGNLFRVDRILTGTLEAVEDAGTQVRRTFWGPVNKMSALVQGIKIGLDVLRSRRGPESAPDRLEQEDELFI